jgi:hypothetical protein
MSKPKLTKKDLQQVKADFKKEKITQVVEENITDLPKDAQLQIARSAGRDLQIQNTGLTPKQLKKADAQALENVRRDYSGTHKVTVSYGFEPGNLVHFKHKNKEEIGIVFKINKSNSTSLSSDAMTQDEVELLSSAGYVKVQAKSIYEIIECN